MRHRRPGHSAKTETAPGETLRAILQPQSMENLKTVGNRDPPTQRPPRSPDVPPGSNLRRIAWVHLRPRGQTTWRLGTSVADLPRRDPCATPRLARAQPRRRARRLVVFRRTASEKPRCPYPEVVEEAICFGWIDSTASILDQNRGLQLLTPREPKSPWTRLNRQRVAGMAKFGLMTDAGRSAVDVARAAVGERARIEGNSAPHGNQARVRSSTAVPVRWSPLPA